VNATAPKWPSAALGDLCEIVIGRTPRRDSPEYWHGTLPWVTIADLNDSIVTHTRECISSLGAEASGAPLLKAGTLLFSFKLTIGKTAVAGVDVYTNEAIAGLIPRNPPRVSTEYLRFALTATDVSDGSSHAVKGKTLNLPLLRAIRIPLPPLPEQKRIAASLREKLGAAVRMRTAAGEQSTIARQVLANELAKVFGMPPDEGTRRTTLGHVLSRRQDVVHPHDYPHGDTVFVGLEHIESDTGHRTGSLEVDMAKLTGRKPRFIKGDIVYGYLRPYLNKVWIAEFDGLCSVDQYVYEPDSSVIRTEYAAWFMRSSVFLARAPIEQAPGQLPRIRAGEVADVAIDLPSLRDQDQRVEALRATSATVKRLSRAIAEQTRATGELPAALLRQAFSGGM
jgi:Type I restriction modification DNA specificity domain